MVVPMAYKDNESEMIIKDLDKSIFKIGEKFAEVIQILD